MTVRRADPISRHLDALSRMYRRIFALVMPAGVPMLGSIAIGVAAPEESESLFVLRVPSRDVKVLLAMLNSPLPLSLKRRRAETAEFVVPTDDSVAALEAVFDLLLER